jgi:hypothetical protein
MLFCCRQYWSTFTANHYLYAGKIVNGINLAGEADVMWGYVGMAATGLIVFFTRHFANNAVFQSYLSADKHRIGFQVHNLLGEPGRKFEVPIGNAKFLSPDQMKEKNAAKDSLAKSLFKSSMIPLRVEGISSNILLDNEGLIKGSEETQLLIDLLEKGQGQGQGQKPDKINIDEAKFSRAQFFNEQRRKKSLKK